MQIIAAVVMIAWVTQSTAFYLLCLWVTRQKMLAKLDPINEDNEWGFGQVGAMLTWLPLAIRTALVLLSVLPFGKLWTATLKVLCKCDISNCLPASAPADRYDSGCFLG